MVDKVHGEEVQPFLGGSQREQPVTQSHHGYNQGVSPCITVRGV